VQRLSVRDTAPVGASSLSNIAQLMRKSDTLVDRLERCLIQIRMHAEPLCQRPTFIYGVHWPEVPMNLQLITLGPIALATAVVLLIVIFACLYIQRRRVTAALRQRFGTEYERVVTEHGSERKAQEKLLDREKRVEKLDIRELDPADRQRFLEQWKTVQAHFVDSPAEA